MGVVNSTSVLVSYVGEPVGDDEAFSMISSVQGNGRPFISNGYSCVAIGTRNIMELSLIHIYQQNSSEPLHLLYPF